MQTLHQQGIETVFLTLHVGIGTFQPVRVNQVETHRMEKETFFISQEAAWQINQAKSAGRKIVAVGTTTTRALESACHPDGQLQAGEQHTQLFILSWVSLSAYRRPDHQFPPAAFDFVDAGICACRSRAYLNAYAEAVVQRYRFYSYGDAMLIV